MLWVHTVLEEGYASATGINFQLDLRVVRKMRIFKNMDTTMNTSRKKVELTAQSKEMNLIFICRSPCKLIYKAIFIE